MDGGNRTLILLLIWGFESIVGFLGNGFIVVMNGHKWLQRRKIMPCDVLLTAIGATRFLILLVGTIIQILYFCSLESSCDNYLWKSCFCAWIYFSSASIWCATWLSAFYCVKITNFPHTFLLWLKLKIDMFVPRLIGLSLTIFSLPFAASIWGMKNYCSPTGNMTGNTSQGEDSYKYRLGIFISLQFTSIVINVSICLTASLLLLTSLWRHTRNLKRSGFATKDCNTQAHINAINALLSFLFFYFLYVVVLTTCLSYSLTLGIIDRLVANVALSLSPSAHPIVLILINPKLKETCIRLLKIRQRIS